MMDLQQSSMARQTGRQLTIIPIQHNNQLQKSRRTTTTTTTHLQKTDMIPKIIRGKQMIQVYNEDQDSVESVEDIQVAQEEEEEGIKLDKNMENSIGNTTTTSMEASPPRVLERTTTVTTPKVNNARAGSSGVDNDPEQAIQTKINLHIAVCGLISMRATTILNSTNNINKATKIPNSTANDNNTTCGDNNNINGVDNIIQIGDINKNTSIPNNLDNNSIDDIYINDGWFPVVLSADIGIDHWDGQTVLSVHRLF
jgi:hypothetical protein